jgi:cytidylate kinase
MSHMGFNGLNVNAHLVEKQLRLWNARCRAHKEKVNEESGFRFLTVAKDEGSLGNRIIYQLAGRLGWHVFDEEIITYISQNSHVSDKLVRQLDQKSQSSIQETIERFLKTLETNSFGGDEYHEGLLVTLMCLARHGSAILVGRGANFALRNEAHGLKVRLTASSEVRAKRLAERWKVGVEEAHRLMHANDEEKRKFIRHYYYHDYDDIQFYDAIYNTDRTPVEHVVSSLQCFIGNADVFEPLEVQAVGNPGSLE